MLRGPADPLIIYAGGIDGLALALCQKLDPKEVGK